MTKYFSANLLAFSAVFISLSCCSELPWKTDTRHSHFLFFQNKAATRFEPFSGMPKVPWKDNFWTPFHNRGATASFHVEVTHLFSFWKNLKVLFPPNLGLGLGSMCEGTEAPDPNPSQLRILWHRRRGGSRIKPAISDEYASVRVTDSPH